MRDLFEFVVMVSAVNTVTFCRALALGSCAALSTMCSDCILDWYLDGHSQANSVQHEDLVLRIVANKKMFVVCLEYSAERMYSCEF
jgi:hypothetical protein